MRHATHTPGPWRVGEQDSHGGIGIVNGDHAIATVYLNEINTRWKHGPDTINQPVNREAKANAQLIAAAPDLLAAAELLLQQYDSNGDFTMGGNLTNEPFLMFRAVLARIKTGKIGR